MARHFVTLGLFIIDEFEYLDEQGNKTRKTLEPQVMVMIIFHLIQRLTHNIGDVDRGWWYICSYWLTYLVCAPQTYH